MWYNSNVLYVINHEDYTQKIITQIYCGENRSGDILYESAGAGSRFTEFLGEADMKIAVCDDEPLICREVIRRISRLSPGEDIFEYHNGKELVNSGCTFDLVFLDIDMPELSGMEAASILSHRRRDTLIIFLTGSREYMPDAFKVRAFRYICKPVDPEEFHEAFFAAKQELCERVMISVRHDHMTCTILLDDVICFEAYGDGTYIYTADEVYTSARSLKSWMEEVGDHCFFQVHRSYAISLRHIQSIETDTITMRGQNLEVPVSRRSRTALKEAFLAYMKENAR